MNQRRWVGLAVVVAILGALWWWSSDVAGGVGDPGSADRSRVGSTPRARERVTPTPTSPGQQPAVPERAGADALDAGGNDAGAPLAEDAGASALSDEQIRAQLERNGKRAAAEIDRFCEDSAKLKKSPLFPESPRRNDAAVFFSSRVDWEGEPPRYGSLRPADPLRQKLKAAGDDYLAVLTDADLAGLDFTWMKQALAYDVWTLRGDGAADESHVTAMWASIPNYMSLVHWEKLRFRKAVRDGDWADAVLEVRHLAALVNSQDLAISSAIAAMMLKLELRARLVAEQAGLNLASLPPPPDASVLELQRPLVVRSGWFTAPGVSREVRKRALECTAIPCITAIEGLSMHSSLRPWAPAGSLDGYLDDVRSLGCDTTLFDRLARRPPATPDEVRELLGAVRDGEPLLPPTK